MVCSEFPSRSPFLWGSSCKPPEDFLQVSWSPQEPFTLYLCNSIFTHSIYHSLFVLPHTAKIPSPITMLSCPQEKSNFPPFLLVPWYQHCGSSSIANRQSSCLLLSHILFSLFFNNRCMYTYNKVSDKWYNRYHSSQLFPVTDLACVQLVYSCVKSYHTYYFENQHLIDLLRGGRMEQPHDYTNPATAAALSKDCLKSSHLFLRFQRCCRETQAGNPCFCEAKRTMLFRWFDQHFIVAKEWLWAASELDSSRNRSSFL